MLDEKRLIENFTKVPGLYSSVEALKEMFGVSLSSSDGIVVNGTQKSIYYRNKENSTALIELKHDIRDQINVIFCRKDYDSYVTVLVRNNKNVEVTFYDGNVHGQIFVVNDKILYYNDNSITTACQLLNGIAHVRSPEEYEQVSVYPDDVQAISSDDINIGTKTFVATSYALELLSQKTKTIKK